MPIKHRYREFNMSDLILASGSPYRKALLERLKIPFRVHSPEIDESPLEQESFEDHVKRLSFEKAYAIAKQYPDALCIGSDEIAGYQQEILGKPLTHEKAVLQLQRLSRQRVTFYTGVCLVKLSTQYEDYQLVLSTIVFRELSPQMIENYLRLEKPYHSAGSFKSETLGCALIERFEGSDPTALIGLPLIMLTQMLEKAGRRVV